jgi:uncharacterized integral membrane protein
LSRIAGPLGVIVVVILAVVFASQNGAERVTLDLGFLVLYRVPVTLVAFGGLFAGMLVMLGAGIQSDLKVRSILRQRLAEEDLGEPELIDTAQRDLFLHSPSIGDLAPGAGAGPEAPPEAPPGVGPESREHPAGSTGRPEWRDMEHGDPME